jgi:hypothetical protein
MRTLGAAAALLALVALAPRPAAAEYGRRKLRPATTISAAAEASPTTWYGDRTLAVDTLGLVGFTGGLLYGPRDPETTAVVTTLGAGTLLLYGPYAHFRRGELGRGVLSLSLRGGALAFGSFLAMGSFDSCDQAADGAPCDGTSRVALATALLLGVVLVDDLLLAHTEVPRARPTWSPSVVPAGGGMTLGLAGTF